MNLFKIVFFSLIITSISVSAQDYNGQSGYGFNRNIGRSYSSPKVSADEIEKDKADRLDKFMNKLKTDLTLDELQFIAIKNEVASNKKAIDIVIKKGSSDAEKTDEIKSLMEKSDYTINSYLNAVQKEKYKMLKDESQSSKKNKKNKKKDNPSNEN